MTALHAALCGSSLVMGIFLIVLGALRRDRGLLRQRRSATGWWRALDAKAQRRLGIALLAGVAVFVLTGWVVMLVAVPALALGVPALLGDPPNRDILILEALDRWVRALAASLPTGKSVADAMRSTAAQSPPLINKQVRLMVARMDDGWPQRDALLALADDLAAPEADAVIAALVLSARRGGTGTTATLEQLSATIRARLRALREIEAERAKPRVVVRQVTTISLVVLGGAGLLNPEFFAPFRTPIGEVILIALLAAYVACLAMLRRMTLPRRRERILQHASPASAREVRHA